MGRPRSRIRRRLIRCLRLLGLAECVGKRVFRMGCQVLADIFFKLSEFTCAYLRTIIQLNIK